MIFEHFLPVIKEVLIERLVLGMVSLYHGCIKSSNFFRSRRKVNLSP